MATRSSAAALFLATILLLAAASALAQAPAPGPSSSPCPLGLDGVLSGMQTPIQLAEIAGELWSLSQSDIVQCICNAANGSTSGARDILNKLQGGLTTIPSTSIIGINDLTCTDD